MVGLHQRAFDIEHESLNYSVAHGELADALAALPRRTLRLYITRNHRASAPPRSGRPTRTGIFGLIHEPEHPRSSSSAHNDSSPTCAPS